MLRILKIVLLSLSMTMTVDHAAAATLTFTPSHDTTIFQEAPGNSNGAGSVFVAGRAGGNSSPPPLRRALLEFDLPRLPQGSVVQSASLTLTLTQSASMSTVAFGLYSIASTWGEAGSVATAPGQGIAAATGDATWTTRVVGATPPAPWASAGGDYAAIASATSFVGGLTAGAPTAYTWQSTAQLVANVQDWIDNPVSNWGWILIGDESAAGTARQFASRENVTAAFRPLLTIVTAPIPEPSSASMCLAGVCMLLAFKPLRGCCGEGRRAA